MHGDRLPVHAKERFGRGGAWSDWLASSGVGGHWPPCGAIRGADFTERLRQGGTSVVSAHSFRPGREIDWLLVANQVRANYIDRVAVAHVYSIVRLLPPIDNCAELLPAASRKRPVQGGQVLLALPGERRENSGKLSVCARHQRTNRRPASVRGFRGRDDRFNATLPACY